MCTYMQCVDILVYVDHLITIQHVNTAILKMKYGIQADIIVDGWPVFDCTIARLPESEEVTQ